MEARLGGKSYANYAQMEWAAPPTGREPREGEGEGESEAEEGEGEEKEGECLYCLSGGKVHRSCRMLASCTSRRAVAAARGKAALDAGTRSTHATAESSKANYRRWTKQGWVYPNRESPSAAPESSREAEGEAAAPARRERSAPKPERLVPRASARGDHRAQGVHWTRRTQPDSLAGFNWRAAQWTRPGELTPAPAPTPSPNPQPQPPAPTPSLALSLA